MPNVSYCSTLSLRVEPGNGSDTKRWNLDWVQVYFQDSNSYYAPFKGWVEQSDPTVTLTAAVGACPSDSDHFYQRVILMHPLYPLPSPVP